MPCRCYNLVAMARVVQAAEFFVVGGPVPPDRPSYVERAADRELEAALRARRLCYVLGAHGTGKSSLLARAARALRSSGELAAVVDLASLEARGEDSDVERWTYAIAHRVVHELRLNVDLPAWWRERTAVSRESRLADFFWDVVLTNTTAAVTIMLDTVERAIELPFGRELLAAIGTCYDRRAREPDYERLGFALAGVASRGQLVRLGTVSETAVSIEPKDFAAEEAYVLALGFGGEPAQTQALMDRVCAWTSGHPYLTQQVARAVENKGGKLEDVERVVHEQLLVPAALNQSPLVAARERLSARRPAARRALGILRRVARGTKVVPPREAGVRDVLLLSGVVGMQDGVLGYRNRIVREAFGTRWVKSVAPLGWRTVAAAAAAVALLGAAGFAYWNYVPRYYERVLLDAGADPAAVDAAYNGLHRLPGFRARADQLLAQALRRRSSDATDVDALVSTDTALRALPGQTRVADRLLADFWLRKTAAAAAAEQRDPALLFALRAALAGGAGAEEARAWVGALVGDDYAELSRTFDLAAAPVRWGVDWQSGLLLAVDSARGVRRAPLAPGAKAFAEAPLALSALAVSPLERALRVEDEGAAGEFELSVAVAHPASAELMLTLTAPSGASAAVPLPQGTGGRGEYFVFAAQAGTPLAALARSNGTARGSSWSSIVARATPAALVGWGLRFGEQSVRDDPDQPVSYSGADAHDRRRVRRERRRPVRARAPRDDRARVRARRLGPRCGQAAGRHRPAAAARERIQLNATHTRVLTSAGDQVTLWNAASGARVSQLATQTEFVLPAVFSADGGFVAIAERVEESPPLLSLLRAEDGTLLASVAGVAGAKRWWLGPGGRYFALLEANNVVHVIDAHRGTDLASLAHARAVVAVLPLPDGTTLLTVDDAGEIRAWSVDSSPPSSAGARPLGTTAAADGVSLSADGSRLAYPAGRGEFVVRAVASGGRVASVLMNDAGGAPRARLSPDGGNARDLERGARSRLVPAEKGRGRAVGRARGGSRPERARDRRRERRCRVRPPRRRRELRRCGGPGAPHGSARRRGRGRSARGRARARARRLARSRRVRRRRRRRAARRACDLVARRRSAALVRCGRRRRPRGRARRRWRRRRGRHELCRARHGASRTTRSPSRFRARPRPSHSRPAASCSRRAAPTAPCRFGGATAKRSAGRQPCRVRCAGSASDRMTCCSPRRIIGCTASASALEAPSRYTRGPRPGRSPRRAVSPRSAPNGCGSKRSTLVASCAAARSISLRPGAPSPQPRRSS